MLLLVGRGEMSRLAPQLPWLNIVSLRHNAAFCAALNGK